MKDRLFCTVLLFLLLFLKATGQSIYVRTPGSAAQQTNPKQNKTSTSNSDYSDSYIGVSVGLAVPAGGLSNTSSSDWSGYAKAGLTFNISAGIDLYRTFGVAAIIGYNRNSYSVHSFINNLSLYNPGIYTNLATRPYTSIYAMLGPFKTFELNDNSYIDLRVMFGATFTNYPNPSWTITDGGGNTSYSINILASSAFAIDFGVGYRYNLGGRFYFLGYFDFFYSRPTYTGTISAQGTAGQASQFLSGTFDVSYLALTAGVGYQLFK